MKYIFELCKNTCCYDKSQCVIVPEPTRIPTPRLKVIGNRENILIGSGISCFVNKSKYKLCCKESCIGRFIFFKDIVFYKTICHYDVSEIEVINKDSKTIYMNVPEGVYVVKFKSEELKEKVYDILKNYIEYRWSEMYDSDSGSDSGNG